MTLTPSEAGKVLAAARLIDNRQFDATTAIAWASMIAETVTLQDALDAVAHHMATSTAYLMPVHINEHVRSVHKRRMQDAGPPDFPSGLTRAQESAYRMSWIAYVKAGLATEQATALADEELGIVRAALVEASPTTRKAIETLWARP